MRHQYNICFCSRQVLQQDMKYCVISFFHFIVRQKYVPSDCAIPPSSVYRVTFWRRSFTRSQHTLLCSNIERNKQIFTCWSLLIADKIRNFKLLTPYSLEIFPCISPAIHKIEKDYNLKLYIVVIFILYFILFLCLLYLLNSRKVGIYNIQTK